LDTGRFRLAAECSNPWKKRLKIFQRLERLMLPHAMGIPIHLNKMIGVHKPVGNGLDRSGPVETGPYRRSHNPKAAG
jgi:hypothetical protein